MATQEKFARDVCVGDKVFFPNSRHSQVVSHVVVWRTDAGRRVVSVQCGSSTVVYKSGDTVKVEVDE